MAEFRGEESSDRSSSMESRRSWLDQYPGLVKTLGSFPEVLSSVTEDFLSASLINLTIKAAVKRHNGPIGAKLLLDTLELKLQQSKDYETVALALLKKHNDLKDVFAENGPIKKKLEVIVPPQSCPRGSSRVGPPNKSPRRSPLSSPLMARHLKRELVQEQKKVITLKELMESFDYLLDRFIELAPQYLDFLKVKVSLCLRYAHYNSPEMEKIIFEFDRCSSVRHAVRYLMDLGLLGHFNFQLLRFFQNDDFKKHLLEHEVKYRLFMENNLDTIAEAMGGATTSETSQGGNILPEMTVIFKKWGTYALSRWVDKLEHSVDWSEYIMMKSMKKTSSTISITYNILPFILSKVVSYIDDSNTVKEFDKVGVAFELPQSVIEQGKTEAVTIESQITASLEEIKFNTAATVRPKMEIPEATFSSHQYIFLTPPQDNFKCNVCFGVLKQTVLLTCCGQLICKGCNQSTRCPYCKNENHRSLPRKGHDDKVINLKVQCIDKDCYWTGRLGDLEGHKCPESESDQQYQKERQEFEDRIAKRVYQRISKRSKTQSLQKSFSEQPSFDESSIMNGLPNNLTTSSFPDGKCVYTVSGPSAKEINWQDKGVISLVIPAGIVPPYESCSITIKPIQPSQCTFPNGMVLVSELFEVTTSCDIKEPITMKLRHCVALNDDHHLECLTFIKAELKELPYCFKMHEGGAFSMGSAYGYLKCRSFSGFGEVIREKLKLNKLFPLRCCALLLHSYDDSKKKHKAHFFVTKDNGDLIKRTAGSLLKNEIEHPQKFELSQSKLTVTCETGSDGGPWKIIPYKTPSEISRKDIADYNDRQSGTTPPCLDYKVTINKACPVPPEQELIVPFTLNGGPDPVKMNLFVDLPVDNSPANEVATYAYGTVECDSSLPEETSHDCLTSKDHSKIYGLVEPLRVGWMQLGMRLDIPYDPELKAIDKEKSTLEEKLMEMLSVWLKRGRKDQPIPSWRILHDAVKTLDRNIAEAIARDHDLSISENECNEIISPEEEHPIIDQHSDMIDGVSDYDGQTPPLPTKSSHDYLNRNEVYRQVESLNAHWAELGLKLGVPYAEIEAIDRKKPTQKQKLMKMLLVWLKRGRKDQPIPSWRILHDAVETFDRSIADVIAEEHPIIDQHPDILEDGHNEMSEEYDEVTLSILGKEPSLKLFMRHIGMKDTIKNGWDDFGKSLGFTEDELVGMTKQETKSGRILAIYDAWEKKQIDRDELTWRSLFKNLHKMKSIKRDIKEWREDVIEEIRSEQMAV